MEMTFKVTDKNGQLVSIETNLELKDIITKKDFDTGNTKITQFTISNKNWFEKNNPSNFITLSAVDQLKIELNNPAYEYDFTVGKKSITPVNSFSNNKRAFSFPLGTSKLSIC